MHTGQGVPFCIANDPEIETNESNVNISLRKVQVDETRRNGG